MRFHVCSVCRAIRALALLVGLSALLLSYLIDRLPAFFQVGPDWAGLLVATIVMSFINLTITLRGFSRRKAR